MPKYVVTGGPCVGKTTVLEAIAQRGYKILQEVARKFIAEEKAKGGSCLPWINPKKFQERIAKIQINLEDTTNQEYVFCDGGLVDIAAYCRLYEVPVPKQVINHGRGRYKQVFILDPPPEYTNDEIRRETQEEAERIYQAVKKAYRDFGYQITGVPLSNPQKRAEYILNRIGIKEI